MREFELQRGFEPAIAAKQCNKLHVFAAHGSLIDAEFALASMCSFNRTVRLTPKSRIRARSIDRVLQ